MAFTSTTPATGVATLQYRDPGVLPTGGWDRPTALCTSAYRATLAPPPRDPAGADRGASARNGANNGASLHSPENGSSLSGEGPGRPGCVCEARHALVPTIPEQAGGAGNACDCDSLVCPGRGAGPRPGEAVGLPDPSPLSALHPLPDRPPSAAACATRTSRKRAPSALRPDAAGPPGPCDLRELERKLVSGARRSALLANAAPDRAAFENAVNIRAMKATCVARLLTGRLFALTRSVPA